MQESLHCSLIFEVRDVVEINIDRLWSFFFYKNHKPNAKLHPLWYCRDHCHPQKYESAGMGISITP